jgi:nickel transport protein
VRLVWLLLLPLLPMLAAATPADAHRLRIFATVEGSSIAGRAFLVGGGRAQGARVVVRVLPARMLAHEGVTDAEGRFRTGALTAADHLVTIDAGDGHIAEVTVPAARFGGSATEADPAAGFAFDEPGEPPGSVAGTVAGACAPGAPALAQDIANAVAAAMAREMPAAIAREIAPLAEAMAEREARLRFSDIIGGLGWIAGLGGLALFLVRRRDGGEAGR